MSNVIDMFKGEELRASAVFEALAEEFVGQDKGVATVVICYRADNPAVMVTGNVEDGAIDLLLGTAVVQRAADRVEEEYETVH